MKQKKKRPGTPFNRKIHFADEETWSYSISSFGVQIRSPKGETTKVSMPDFTGWNWDEIERAHWKKYWLKIGPKDIKDYITKNLRK
jgi:hypothetical protein